MPKIPPQAKKSSHNCKKFVTSEILPAKIQNRLCNFQGWPLRIKTFYNCSGFRGGLVQSLHFIEEETWAQRSVDHLFKVTPPGHVQLGPDFWYWNFPLDPTLFFLFDSGVKRVLDSVSYLSLYRIQSKQLSYHRDCWQKEEQPPHRDLHIL